MTPPLPDGDARWALFLDFDGTLAELAAHPDAVDVDPQLAPLLERLGRLLGGALAVISGRRLDSLEAMLSPARPPAAGLHGLERRGAAAPLVRRTPALERARRSLAEFVAAHPGLLLEDKGGTLALHYRNAPALEASCREAAARAARDLRGHHVLDGKMVLEIKPRDAHKGAAIRDFLREPPFSGRVAVFAGDDRTDEDGFAWVNAHGGISVKVGDGETCATHRVADVAGLHAWLERLARHLERSAAA